ncbi:MAG: ferrous iron transport protein B [Methylacidiphilales bacterium]|nr:ferrous iron transport protein B [Candidatus Methylacidiphilales bacterium]
MIQPNPDARQATVAVIGNPNTGKSTLFNKLTGKRQRVGNYPGVTVEKKTGRFQAGGWDITLVDLPGAYSLAASSPDERVAVDVLTGQGGNPRPDLIICVIDASNLLRNLFLAMQAADFGIPMVLALNLWDEAKKTGIEIDPVALAEKLGVPVAPTVATRGEGIEALKLAVERSLETPSRMNVMEWPSAVDVAIGRLDTLLNEKHDCRLSKPEFRRVLFDSDSAILGRCGISRHNRLAILEEARKPLFEAGLNPLAAEAVLIYDKLGEVVSKVETRTRMSHTPLSEKLDHILTHRFLGLALFAAMMFLVFQAIYSWARPVMEAMDWATKWAQGHTASLLSGSPMLSSLLTDGVIAGVGSVIAFLPQILILFFFISVLEDSGYMARAAFLMDKLFSWCGLNGKSFVPMLSSYACAIPGVMSARTIEDPKARLVTILIAPLMSCSARLPVYVLMIGAFVEPSYGRFTAGLLLFSMHFIGLALALPLAFVFNRFLLKTHSQPFLLELPPYRMPEPANVFWRMWERGREFLKRAGTVILALSIVIWALVYFPRPPELAQKVRRDFVQEQVSSGRPASEVGQALEQPGSGLSVELKNREQSAYVQQSLMGRLGRTVQPVFAPAGFDWKITIGVLASFPAREVIISTLGIIYNLGAEVDEHSGPLRERLAAERWTEGPLTGRPVFTLPVVLGIMVFFALCLQCGSTVAIIGKEAGWKWSLFAFCYMTGLAWLGAVLVYQAGTAIFPV